MKVFKIPYQEGLSNLDYLEQIYKKVRLQEKVKFNGKAYVRIVPKNNKYYKYPYHFDLAVEDIYAGNMHVIDQDGEEVTIICNYKIEIQS